MKALIILFLSISSVCFSQELTEDQFNDLVQPFNRAIPYLDKPVHNKTITDLHDLMQDYITYCYEDSLIVGYEYVLDENESMGTSLAIYSRAYDDIIERLWTNFDGYWDLNSPNGLSADNLWIEHFRGSNYNQDYLRTIPIKYPHEKPTFEGFFEWLNNKLK